MWQKVNFIHEIAFSLSSFTIHRIQCRKMGPNWHWSTNQWNVQGKLLLRLGIEIWVFPGSSVKEEEQVRAQYIGTQNYFAFCWSIKSKWNGSMMKVKDNWGLPLTKPYSEKIKSEFSRKEWILLPSNKNFGRSEEGAGGVKSHETRSTRQLPCMLLQWIVDVNGVCCKPCAQGERVFQNPRLWHTCHLNF